MLKNYVLDSNILLHDPYSIFQFADNSVIIPVEVISEIDRFKKERTDRGYNARAVARQLDGLRGGESLTVGVPLKTGGTLKVYCDPDELFTSGNGEADTEIIRTAQLIQRAEPGTPTIIVTKDINLRIRAEAAGLRAEDYESDHVSPAALETGQMEYRISAEQLDEFNASGQLTLDGESLSINEYVLMRSNGGEKTSALGRVNPEGSNIQALHEAPKGLWGIKPRNKEQYYAIDALLDEQIQLVSLMGKAGTGKTLLAIAAAVERVMKSKEFRGALIARPIFPLGRDLGFLPGDIAQKLDPWMKPIVDTLDLLLETGGPIKGYSEGGSVMNDLLDGSMIEVQPLAYIRGRSVSNRFVVIDEAQNLTPLEVKTVITRIGQGSKVVLTGDPDQIDNPYVDSNSNGFTYLVNRFRNQPIAAHIRLRKGERSNLAEMAANLL
jgi:PhoH-like ATPase